MHFHGALVTRLLTLCILVGSLCWCTTCEARLFDQQIKDKLSSDFEAGKPEKPLASSGEVREPMRRGPFGAMLRRDKGNSREDQDDEDEEKRGNSIAMLDLLNISSHLATFLLAVWPCLCQLYRSVEAFMLTATFSDVATDNRRFSSVWVSWLTLASVAIVATVVMKRVFACPPPPPPPHRNGKEGGRRGTSKKAVSFQTCSLPVVDQTTYRVYRDIPPAMVAMPGDETLASKVAARWINHILVSLLAPSDGKIFAVCLQRWVEGLNRAVKETLIQDDMLIEFVGIPVISMPHLSNVAVTLHDSAVTITSDFSIPTVHFHLQVFDPKGCSTSPVAEFHVICTDLSSIISSELVDQTLHIRFSACNQPNLELVSSSAASKTKDPLMSLSDGIRLAILEALALATVTISLADLHIAENFLQHADNAQISTCLKDDTLSVDCDTLEVTNIKCYCSNALSHLYLTLTMDSPLQVLETWQADETAEMGKELMWKQKFVFFTRANTEGELLLELWNELDDTLWSSQAFSVDELRHPERQEHFLHLKGQSNEALSLEIQFWYHPQAKEPKSLNAVSTILEKRRLTSLSGQFYDSVKYTYQIQTPKSKDVQEMTAWKTCVSNAFLQDIEKRQRGIAPTLLKPERSTMIIRSIQEHETDRWRGSHPTNACNMDAGLNKNDDTLTGCDSESADTESTCSENSLEVEKDLTCWRGKVSKSWESINSAHLSLPQSLGADDASSLSEVSAVSSCSAHVSGPSGVESVVVLEVLEQGLTRHYLIPKTLLKKNRIKRKGLKLHIASEHVFVATHIKSSETCAVCCRKIMKRIGKQGYVCRDCDLICHKNCHTKVDVNCAKSSLSQMELLRGSTIF